MYVDSHCHLSFPELHARVPEIREAMERAGVDRALCICTTLEEFETVHGLALAHDNFWASVGVHPDNEDVQEPTLEDLLRRAALPAASRGRDRRDGAGLLPAEWPQRRRHGVAA
jgi:TatD DNase family protein